MAFGNNLWANQGQLDAARLSRRQGNEALVRGEQAANLSDPFSSERPQYKTQLSTLLSNPGQLDTSPFYKYLRDTQMEGVKASNAARGFTNSGRGLMALQDRAAGVASQAYFPQANLLAMLSGAAPGSPATAANAFSRGSERSQDYGQQSLAQRNYQPPSGPAERPWYDTPFFNDKGYWGGAESGGSTGLPSGGYTQSYDNYAPSYAPSYGNALPADYLTVNNDSGYDDYSGFDDSSGYGDYEYDDSAYDDYYGYE